MALQIKSQRGEIICSLMLLLKILSLLVEFSNLISWSTPIVEKLMVTHLDKRHNFFFQPGAHCSVHKNFATPFDPYHDAVVSVLSVTVYCVEI
jgi:hypothetical protein